MPATKEELAVFQAGLLSFPDYVVAIDGYRWHVHSSVVSRSSRFFEKVCNGSFKESAECQITLHDDCPWIVARMIRWFYFGNQVVPSIFASVTSNAALDTMMQQGSNMPGYQELRHRDSQREMWEVQALTYQIADKYEVAELMEVSRVHLARSVKGDPLLLRDLVDYLDVSSLQHDRDLSRGLLEAVLCQGTETSVAYAEIKSLLGHDSNIMDMAHGILVEELEKRTNKLRLSQQYNKLFLTYIDQAHNALTGNVVSPTAGNASANLFSATTQTGGGPLFGQPQQPTVSLFSQPSQRPAFGGGFSQFIGTPESRMDKAKQILETARVNKADVLNLVEGLGERLSGTSDGFVGYRAATTSPVHNETRL